MMMNKQTHRSLAGLAACLLPFLASCGDAEDPSERATSSESRSGGLPSTLIVDSAPEGASSVVEARANAKPGEAVVLRGRVGGKMTPLPENAALLVLADEKAIVACSDTPDDPCTTPWDYCCEESAKIAASTASVQVRDADGKVIRKGLRGVGGLKELSTLVVSGVVDEASTDEALLVNATSIYVEKP